MAYLRWLLLPFSILYGIAVWTRNRLYDWGWLHQTDFELPVIVVGNLEVGGTGKTPMTEYLIRLLADRYKLATLSRGYGRKTTGYRIVTVDSKADESGDEPLQFKQKFPLITVAVDEDRVRGVGRLEGTHDLVLLDDAFQHRALKPGMSIVLFDYNRLYRPRFLLPAGDYRDWFRERRRADTIVITKCPPDLAEEERGRIIRRMSGPEQTGPLVLFSHMVYGDPVAAPFIDKSTIEDSLPSGENVATLLITGIARPEPLFAHCQARNGNVEHLRFPDHHRFSPKDLQLIRQRFELVEGHHKIIITTEKDVKRLAAPGIVEALKDLPLYYIPIRLAFQRKDGELFDRRVLAFAAGAQEVAAVE